MSYDIYLEVDTGAERLTPVVEIGNYTSNVSAMWTKALGCGLYELDGIGAAEALPKLEIGVAAMVTDPDGYREMNPANGWGRYDGALEYLERLRDACAEHPKTRIRVSH